MIETHSTRTSQTVAPTSSPLVCILTAGRGSRMGGLTNYLNKALLPVDKRAIISQIIERFPPQSSFVIALGHKAEQVKTYLEMAHPDAKITFVNVENYNGPGSGPGESLLACRKHLQRPFFFVACDTLWQGELDFSANYDWFAVASVPEEESMHYCNFQIENGKVVKIVDKKKVSGNQFRAFTGLCHIHHHKEFWNAIASKELINGEHQISNGTNILVKKYQPVALPIEWLDTGTKEKYTKVVERYESFDFSKPDEALYILNQRVIKYFANPDTAHKRVLRVSAKKGVFPEILGEGQGFYSYRLCEGNIVYEEATPEIFASLLAWLERNLWSSVKVEPTKMHEVCRRFYRDKTLERITAFERKYEYRDGESTVNGIRIPSTSDLLEQLPWDMILNGIPVIFHGDLHFDNILYNRADKTFRLIDWRHDFGGEVNFGDLYYDLAKMNGGFTLNYDYIKKGLFYLHENGEEVTIDFARRALSDTYREMLKDFTAKKNLDWKHVSILTALIFLNMSPLHTAPFDRLLYSLGRLTLHRELSSP